MVLEYTSSDKDEPAAIASGAAPTFAADLTELAAWLADGRIFRKAATQAALIATTGNDDNDLGTVDNIDGAWFRYDGSVPGWKMYGIPVFASTGARDSAITVPADGDRARVGTTIYLRLASAWVVWTLPWTSYAPTIANWNSATVAPTTTGRYCVSDGVAHVIVQSKLGTGTITVGNVTVSLPVAAVTTGMILDSTLLAGATGQIDVSVPQAYFSVCRILDANTVRVMRSNSATPGGINVVSATQPFTWATLDELSAAFSYPVA